MTFPGRLLAIDYGLKVIGLAVCDPTGLIARPLRTLERASKRVDFAQIDALIVEQEIVGVIVGLPESPPEITGYTQADRVRLWAGRLAAAIRVPVYLWNERYSSQEAEDLLAAAGRDQPDRVDAAAAAVILQSFLDALRDEGFPWPDPVESAEN
ncbi:MAG: Holliday junction resolvase RuvX [Anaerolineae bacterium]|nr:Holliday junction resolvase RuvX [Anaerolineae bacterium]